MTKRLVLLLICFCGSTTAATPIAANAIVGDWVMPDGSALIRITYKVADDSFEGTIAALLRPEFTVADDYGEPGLPRQDVNNPAREQREQALLGMKILTNLKFADGKWQQGQVYDPASGRTYRCKLELAATDYIELRGFVGFSLLGRTMYWQRAPAFRRDMRALLEAVP